MKQIKLFFLLFALMLSISANAVIQEGSCGTNVNFVLNDDGTLVISGSGAMEDYYDTSDVPWYSNRSKIIKATIEDGVTSIGEMAFYGCSGLTSVTIPNSVTSIGEYAFSGCKGLTSVTIPNSVTSIGEGAFYGCSGLTSVTIPNSVTSIGKHAFKTCSSLTSVTIPNSVTSIGNYAFYNCSSLTSVNIPNSVTSIGKWTFGACKGLTSVTIPNSVTSIGEGAFSSCSGLTSVTVDANNPNYYSADNVIYTKDKSTLVYCMTSKEGDFVIPNSVTSIGDDAFFGCTGLTSVTIPNSVTSIGDDAFLDCTALREIHSNNITPPECGSNCFRNVKTSQCKLYVPTGSKEDYQFANGWSDFVNIIEEDVVTPTDGIEKPTISFKDNTIYFDSNNANAKYLYTIQATDVVASLQEAENGSVPLTGTYIVTAYAKTDDGTSEAATATLNFPLEKEVEKEVEVFIYDDTHANIDLPTGERVTIEIREGIVTIKSLPINSTVYVYTEGGELWETRRVNSASLTLDLPRHSVYIIKTSGKTFKVKI